MDEFYIVWKISKSFEENNTMKCDRMKNTGVSFTVKNCWKGAVMMQRVPLFFAMYTVRLASPWHFLVFHYHLCPIPSSRPLFLSQKYVQDVLREQLSETVYQRLREEGGHIYVCGDVTMAGDVLKTIQQIIKLHGNMSLEDAGFYISKLRVRTAPNC